MSFWRKNSNVVEISLTKLTFNKIFPLKAKCLLSNDIYDYHYVSQGKTSVPSIDDNEDLEFTHEAFNILHFTEEETYNIYKCVSAVMNMGELVS